MSVLTTTDLAGVHRRKIFAGWGKRLLALAATATLAVTSLVAVPMAAHAATKINVTDLQFTDDNKTMDSELLQYDRGYLRGAWNAGDYPDAGSQFTIKLPVTPGERDNLGHITFTDMPFNLIGAGGQVYGSCSVSESTGGIGGPTLLTCTLNDFASTKEGVHGEFEISVNYRDYWEPQAYPVLVNGDEQQVPLSGSSEPGIGRIPFNVAFVKNRWHDVRVNADGTPNTYGTHALVQWGIQIPGLPDGSLEALTITDTPGQDQKLWSSPGRSVDLQKRDAVTTWETVADADITATQADDGTITINVPSQPAGTAPQFAVKLWTIVKVSDLRDGRKVDNTAVVGDRGTLVGEGTLSSAGGTGTGVTAGSYEVQKRIATDSADLGACTDFTVHVVIENSSRPTVNTEYDVVLTAGSSPLAGNTVLPSGTTVTITELDPVCDGFTFEDPIFTAATADDPQVEISDDGTQAVITIVAERNVGLVVENSAYVTPKPAIEMVKSAEVEDVNGNGINDAGDKITWKFAVENTGNTTLENISIKDAMLEGLGVAITCDPTTLDAGQSGECASEAYTITEADVETGSIKNIATATGQVPDGTPGDPANPESPESEAEVPLTPTPKPAIEMVKSYEIVSDTNDNGINDPGDIIKWTFTVTNTGNVDLNDVVVNDPKLDELGIEVTCDAAPLAAKAVMVCESGEYTITEADAEAGSIVNVATATGEVPDGTPGDPEDPVSPPDEVEIPTDPTPAPAVTLDKGYVLVADTNKNGINDPGDIVKWTFKVKNTGNVTLEEVSIDDPKLDKLKIEVTCPAGPLLPGLTAECESGEYTITEADAAAGSIVNVATATGKVPEGTPGDPEDPKSPEDEVEIPTDPTPAPSLDLVKTAFLNDKNGNKKADAGETIDYSFVVTNTGNTVLTGVGVDDPMLEKLGIDVTCVPTTLAPGAEATCTAAKPYTVTEQDVKNGKVHNVATAHGTPPEGIDPPESPKDEVDVPTGPVPQNPLVTTGGQLMWPLAAAGAIALLAGGVLLVGRRRQEEHTL